jgi:hypothetical protein
VCVWRGTLRCILTAKFRKTGHKQDEAGTDEDRAMTARSNGQRQGRGRDMGRNGSRNGNTEECDRDRDELLGDGDMCRAGRISRALGRSL